MHSTTTPAAAAFLPDELPIVADLACRLGRVPTEAEARAACDEVDAHYRAAFAPAFRRAGIAYRP